MANPPKIIIIGAGDTGVLAAMQLASKLGHKAEITCISTKPCFVSGQELGLRLAQNQRWQRDYQFDFSAFKQLDKVNMLHAKVQTIDANKQLVHSLTLNGEFEVLAYDALLIASGVTNGFWRDDKLKTLEQIEKQFQRYIHEISKHGTIAIVGGGPSAVSSAYQLKRKYPEKIVHLFYSGKEILPQYAEKTCKAVTKELAKLGVVLHPNHRVKVSQHTQFDSLGCSDTLYFIENQKPFKAECVLWAIGQCRPNNSFIPAAMLNAQGYVKVNDNLQVEGFDNVFAVGDIAASDQYRSSARNGGALVAAKNIQAVLKNKTPKKTFSAPNNRWGSVLGIQPEGLSVFSPKGRRFHFSRAVVDFFLYPLIVRKVIYKGVKD